MDAPPQPAAALYALRVAVAGVVCLVIVAWLRLEHANLAVWTTNMILAQITAFTAFQRGLERVVGRGLGIVVGLLLVVGFHNAAVAGTALKLLALFIFFYVHFSGRLAYTFLNAGLYLAVIVEIGDQDPVAALPEGWSLFIAVLVGAIVADLVVWLWGFEGSLRVDVGSTPLFPLQWDRVAHALLMVVTVELAQVVTRWLALPTSAALVSVMITLITPDLQSVLFKGELRLAGALLGLLWGLGTFLALSLLPHLAVLAGFLFLGMFLAGYLARVGDRYSYAGVQMGLVLPLVVVVPANEIGLIGAAFQRIEGIVAAVSISLLVAGVWAVLPWSQATSLPPAQR